ncbi:unnamed protein product [Cylindrotheca closterium]|uniref:Uncharacterized protein n=1 Tax=Cylindrotheca closterium TaxID=2856 RepID=A0AAD2G7D8_9STRA|nr:unnamed protein product [Cylindrotheca closterium]
MRTISTPMDEAGHRVWDSLPYFESANKDYEEYALALIEDEMKLVKPPILPDITPIRFRSAGMKKECEILIVGSKFEQRKQLPHQKHQGEPRTEKASISGVQDAKCKYETERIRSQLLEVEKNEAAESWKSFNESLSLHQMELSRVVKKQFEAVEEINYERQKAQQQQLGPQIETLSTEYQRTLYRRNQFKHSIGSRDGNEMHS